MYAGLLVALFAWQGAGLPGVVEAAVEAFLFSRLY